ncbi:MAG: hypothetical protein OXH58_12195 [Acidimicrobiaceae bacterium]|nr:hypothetical protein [Acidimicrobiaceae bacterium]
MPSADWQPDPTGRHELRRRNPNDTWSDEVADSGVLSRDPFDGTQPEPVSEPEPDRSEPDPASDEFSVWLAASVASMRQIQRWIGWIAAIVIVYAVASFLLGMYVAFSEPDPQPFILQ